MTEPAATSGLTPYINVDGVAEAIGFYQKAFGAIERARNLGQDGQKVIHAHLEINGAPLFMSDFFPEAGYKPVQPQAFNLHLQVSDAQQWWDRAVAAGAVVQMPLKKEFWGDIYGQVVDPYGVVWAIGQSEGH